MSHDNKPTPGPWVTDRTTVERKLAVRAADSRFAICTFEAFVKNHEANARLCAAAPDLLEALKAVLAEEMIYTGAIVETLEKSGQHLELTAKILAAIQRAGSEQ